MKIRYIHTLCLSAFCCVFACDVRFPCTIERDCPGGKCIEGFCQNLPLPNKPKTCEDPTQEGCPCNYLDKPHGVCKDLKRDTSGKCPKPEDYSQTEICGDGKDNNCDGIIDENCCPVSCSIDSDCAPCPSNLRTCVNGKCGQAVQCPVYCDEGLDDACAPCPANQRTCVSGKCSSCPAEQTVCSGTCVDVQRDANHCGICGNKCNTGYNCTNGKCDCPVNRKVCSGTCVDVQRDTNHCGTCGNKCSTGQICLRNKCTSVAVAIREVKIPKGSFMMGSPSNELARGSDELQHQVTLTRPFMIGKYEVTQEEFQALMGYNPSHFTDCGLNCPVENVTWHEAVAFMNGLSVSQGLEECFDCTNSDSSINCEVKPQYSGQNYYNCKGYRLPTEAEWEYAYRSGTTAAFYNGDITQMGCNPLDPNLDKIGWYCGNAGGKIHPAGDKQANAWDLYDMAGNVGEWVYDWYAPYPSTSPVVDPVGVSNTGSNRVSRGGLWRYGSQSYRAAYRYSDSPNVSNRDLGFRFLRSLPEK